MSPLRGRTHSKGRALKWTHSKQNQLQSDVGRVRSRDSTRLLFRAWEGSLGTRPKFDPLSVQLLQRIYMQFRPSPIFKNFSSCMLTQFPCFALSPSSSVLRRMSRYRWWGRARTSRCGTTTEYSLMYPFKDFFLLARCMNTAMVLPLVEAYTY